MTTDPSEIRAQIEQTRASLSTNVNALADQANPAHMAQRAATRAKRKGSMLLDRVLGAAEDARDATMDAAHNLAGNVSDSASGAGDAVTGAPRAVRQQTQGNPVAAGLVAFGIGLLLAGAFPASRKEEELAQTVKEKAQPLTDSVTEAAKEVASNMAEPAQQAGESLKESANQAFATVKDEGSAAVADVKDEGSTAVSDVKSDVADSTAEVKDTVQQSAEEVRSSATGSNVTN